MQSQQFDDLTEVYEVMIDWPRRLANEGPFYRELFQRIGAQRVLDAACGTGHHAAVFHGWGLHVQAADISPTMLRLAREQFGAPPGLDWTLRGFDQPVDQPPFDAAVCIGNSLALAARRPAALATIGNLLAAVRSGGVVVIHLLNLWRLAEGQPVWQKCQRKQLAQGDSLIIKGVHRCGAHGYVDLLVTLLSASPPVFRSDCVPFWALQAAELEAAARSAGAATVELLGDYQRQPYAPQTSPDLIMVASKG